MQGQRRAGVAVGQHQHRKAADGNLGIFRGSDAIGAQRRAVLKPSGGIEGDGLHRLQIQRIQERHAMEAHTPMRVRRRRGVH